MQADAGKDAHVYRIYPPVWLRLSRRPRELSASHDVKVEMPHRLPCLGAVVGDEAKVVGVARLPGDGSRGLDQLAAQRLVGEVRELCDVATRNDKDVKRRARVVVLERDDVGVLVDDRRWDLFRRDPAEDAIGHVRTLPA